MASVLGGGVLNRALTSFSWLLLLIFPLPHSPEILPFVDLRVGFIRITEASAECPHACLSLGEGMS